MKVGVVFKGTKKLAKKLKAAERTMVSCADKAMFDQANIILRYAKKNMAKVSRGKQYGNHTASKPGDYPNVDTGMLVNSIYAKKVNALTWVVGTPLVYGKYLEYGTRKMEARPWLKRSLDDTKKEQSAAREKRFKKCMEKLK